MEFLQDLCGGFPDGSVGVVPYCRFGPDSANQFIAIKREGRKGAARNKNTFIAAAHGTHWIAPYLF